MIEENTPVQAEDVQAEEATVEEAPAVEVVEAAEESEEEGA